MQMKKSPSWPLNQCCGSGSGPFYHIDPGAETGSGLSDKISCILYEILSLKVVQIILGCLYVSQESCKVLRKNLFLQIQMLEFFLLALF
jgi:hypothetical protein